MPEFVWPQLFRHSFSTILDPRTHSEHMIDKSDLKNLIRTHLAPQLKAAGFKKTGLVWNRRCDSLVHVIQIQLSQWNDADEISFTINVGVLVPRVMQIVRGEEPPKTVRETNCYPRFRIGSLPNVGAGRDIWWELHEPDDVDRVGPEIAKEVVSKCLPALESCSSIEATLQFAGRPSERQPAGERFGTCRSHDARRGKECGRKAPGRDVRWSASGLRGGSNGLTRTRMRRPRRCTSRPGGC